MPSASCSTMARWISCQGVWLAGKWKPPWRASASRRRPSSSAGIMMSAEPLLRSTRMRSPVLMSARPPPAAASGEALRIEGEPEGPDWRARAGGGGFGRGVEDRGRARGAGLAAVADARQRRDAAFDQRGGRLHVDHLGRARIADRPDAADPQDGALVDAERRVPHRGGI